MGLVIILLFQLWNQPSIRILGFGKDFAGFIPDPITDLSRNPAYLKKFAYNYEESYNSLQIYAAAQRYDYAIDSIYIPDQKARFSHTSDPFLIMLFHPRIGVGFRSSIFTRIDERNNQNFEQWLYGQCGFFGAMHIGRHLTIGCEYNFSQNCRPDIFYVEGYDTSDVIFHVPVAHNLWSNELGGGVVLNYCYHNMDWQISFAFRNNKEHNFFVPDTELHWHDEWLGKWHARREETEFDAAFGFNSRTYRTTIRFKYYDVDRILELYFRASDSLKAYFTAFEPGISIVYEPNDNLLVVGGIIFNDWWYYGLVTKGIVLPIGIEMKFGHSTTFRVGCTSFIRKEYWYKGIMYEWHMKNEFCFGIDVAPQEKLKFFLATQDPFDYYTWFFGLSLVL